MKYKFGFLAAVYFLFFSTICAFADNGILFTSQRDFLASKGLTFDPYVIEDYAGAFMLRSEIHF